MKTFGLLGKNISYSFSRGYFTKKFETLKLTDYEYVNFDLPSIELLPTVLNDNVLGFNVTIPYKEAVMEFLDIVSDEAREIGAVNTVKVENGKLKGFNTDYVGFEESIKPLLKSHHKKALILGTGGASKAVKYVLERLKIQYRVVSRNPSKGQFSYNDITKKIIEEHTIIINCTPLGTFPNIDNSPDIPYKYLNNNHLLYDLIYNPAKTTFLAEGERKGATIFNGQKMLELQAEKAWEIWNS